jgi:hypothetical protein
MLVVSLTFLTACAEGELDGVDEVESPAEDDGKSDADTELRVRAGDTTLWVTREVARRGDLYVLRGRTSRNITDGMGFVFDDPYGDFAQRSARTFEVTWPVSTIRSLADGVNQFVRIGFVPSASRPDSLAARVVVRPRLGGFAGSSKIYLTAELTPVVVGGMVVYRMKGKTTVVNARVRATAGGVAIIDLRRLDDTRFEIDVAPEALGQPIVVEAFVADPAGDRWVTKTAALGLSIKRLGFTVEDPYEQWPRPECTSATRTCLTGLPDGALDLAACGEAIVVNACAGQVGVFVDDVSVQAAIADGGVKTSSATFLDDARGLVGAARVDAFAYGAQQTLEDKVQSLYGRWYLQAGTRDRMLEAAVDGGIDLAYARPLDLVDPITTPAPGNAAATRQLAADALLAHLTTWDFADTEYGRSLVELTRMFRARHVESIRAFRESIAIEPYPGMPQWDVLVGDWLDAYVEVSIVKTTGAIDRVYLEID